MFVVCSTNEEIFRLKTAKEAREKAQELSSKHMGATVFIEDKDGTPLAQIFYWQGKLDSFEGFCE